MNESTGYATITNRSFPPVKGKIVRKGIPNSVRRRMNFLKTHNIIISENAETGEPIVTIKEKNGR